MSISREFDVAVIGGGIQGVGVAQAAAAAGYSTIVLEQTALAHGTSSKSSKLIHGGLRYLESGQFSLVRQSLQERSCLIANAPELVHYTPFYIPIYKHTSRHRWQIFLGLSLYAFLGNFRAHACFRRVPQQQWSQLDGLSTQGLRAVYQYWDAQTDDARLTQAVMHSAQQLGAKLLCPAKVTHVRHEQGQYAIGFTTTTSSMEIRARVLVNAGGPWVENIHRTVTPAVTFPQIDMVQGTHLVLDQAAPEGVYYVESSTDRRAVFIMPWYGKTLIGTTEKKYSGDPEQVHATDAEVDYLLSIARHYFPYSSHHVVQTMAGLRVLPTGKSSVFSRPRDTVLFTDVALPGYIALIGGKLTGYRATAEKTVALFKSVLPSRKPVANTRELALK